MVLPRWTKRTAAASVTLPASLLALAAAPGPVSAQVVAVPGPSLRILTPRAGEALGAKSFNLDVAYKSQSGTAVIAAEVWVDGVRWHRHTPEAVRSSGTFRFALDASSLSAGAHTVVVKVFDAKNALSETAINVVAGNAAGADVSESGNGPVMTFVAPNGGKPVSGTISLSVEATDRSGANPYVSFFIDSEFKTLKNFPPYRYDWDTTKAANGWHVVEAVGYGAASQDATKRRLRVFVDNPGGATVRQPDIPDLSRKAAPTPMSPAGPLRPAPIAGGVLTIPLPGAQTSASARRTPGVRIARAHWTPSLSSASRPAAPVAVAPGIRASLGAGSQPFVVDGPQSAGVLGGVRSAQMRRVAAPAPSLANPVLVVPAVAPVRAVPAVRSAPRVAARMGEAIRVAAAPARYAPLPAARVMTMPRATSPKSPRAAARPVTAGTGALQVAFDGERIAFDVPPRVEAGMPLAPFRQIFEHTGGVVTWVPSTKIVRAVNADREVILAVGKRHARVNDQTVAMEKAPYLEQGRAIVPLSFVGKALDVDIQYDPVTGRLQITSK